MVKRKVRMKNIWLVVLLLVIPSFASAEDNAVEAKWVLNSDELLKYRTVNSSPEQSYVSIKIDSDKVIKDGRMDEQLRKKLGENIQNYYSTAPKNISSTISVLKKTDGNFMSLNMFHEKIAALTLEDFGKNDDFGMDENQLKIMNENRQEIIGTSVLQSTINHTGKNMGFYLGKGQKILVNLAYQLPPKPVKIGDTWSIDAECISIAGQEVIEASKINRVEFTRLTKNKAGDEIAEFDYLFIEKAKSKNSFDPIKHDMSGEEPTLFTCSYIGRHYFNITKGQWHKTFGEMHVTMSPSMGFGAQQSVQIISMELTDDPVPKAKLKEEPSIMDKWEELRKLSENKNDNTETLQKPLLPKRQTVVLDNKPRSFDEKSVEYTPKIPLPFTGWKSGVCFVIGTLPNSTVDERKAILEKTFGSSDKSKPFIAGHIKGNTGLEYILDGKMIEILERENADSQEIKMHVCACISCASKGQEKPENISSVKFNAVKPFQAESVYWYTTREGNANYTTEDPLRRWRVLQEEREQREQSENQK